MTTAVSTQDPIYKNPTAGAVIGGVVTGTAVKGSTKIPMNAVSKKAMRTIKNMSREISQEELTAVQNSVFNTIKRSGLEAKGVGVIKATAENSKEITEIMGKEINNSLFRFMPKIIKDICAYIFKAQMQGGENACYTFASKKIIMPEKELGLALFHETGHAMNANLSTIGRILQKCRLTTILAIPIAAIALFKTKKAPGEEPQTKMGKTTTFIKENAGKLTFATFLPILIEEAMASIKGNKYAKKLLNPELAKKVAKTNLLGFSTYLISAVATSLGIFLGTKVKDSIAKRKVAEVSEAQA